MFGFDFEIFCNFLEPEFSQIKSLYPLPSVPNSKLRISKEFFVFLLLIIVDDEASEKISFVLKSLFLITFEYVSEVNNKTFPEIFVEIKPLASDKR